MVCHIHVKNVTVYMPKVKEYYIRYQKENPEKKKETNRKTYLKMKQTPDFLKKKGEYKKRKKQTDLNFRMKENLRCRIYGALKGISKSKETMELIGCSIEYLKYHLEIQFTEGMTWDNYGKWHVDHIVPCSAWDLTDTEGQKECFYYLNLQPLWAKDNLSKGSKIL